MASRRFITTRCSYYSYYECSKEHKLNYNLYPYEFVILNLIHCLTRSWNSMESLINISHNMPETESKAYYGWNMRFVCQYDCTTCTRRMVLFSIASNVCPSSLRATFSVLSRFVRMKSTQEAVNAPPVEFLETVSIICFHPLILSFQ